jgi:hypothetical protein
MSANVKAEMTVGDKPVPVNLFSGYDTVSRGMLSSSAVAGEHQKSGGKSSVQIAVCESLSELARALEIDASLSVGYLKTADVTAKMEFVKNLDVTARSVSIVVYAHHQIGTWTARDVKLQDTVNPPTDHGASASRFALSYGDSFVSSVTLGGEYYAVYIFNTETREEQQTLAASLKVAVRAGAKVEADSQVKLSEVLNSTKTSWTLKQEITGIDNPEFPNETKLIEFALKFSKLVPNSPVITGIKVQGLESVFKSGSVYQKVAKNRRYFLDPDDGLLPSLARLTTVRNQVEWLKNIYDRYNYQGDISLLDFERDLLKDVKAINNQVADWEFGASGTFEAPKLSTLTKGEPILQFDQPEPPLWGGPGPGHAQWDFPAVGDAIRNRTRIRWIRLSNAHIRGFDVLGRLEVEYISDKKTWTETHGTDPREAQPKLYLEEGQFPVRFEVGHGTYVDRLKIHLSDGRTTASGGSGGAKVDWKVPADHFVVGFGGWSGACIDQLQILHAKLKPAKMVKAR